MKGIAREMARFCGCKRRFWPGAILEAMAEARPCKRKRFWVNSPHSHLDPRLPRRLERCAGLAVDEKLGQEAVGRGSRDEKGDSLEGNRLCKHRKSLLGRSDGPEAMAQKRYCKQSMATSMWSTASRVVAPLVGLLAFSFRGYRRGLMAPAVSSASTLRSLMGTCSLAAIASLG